MLNDPKPNLDLSAMYGIVFVMYRGGHATCLDGPSVGGSGLTAYLKPDAQQNAAALNQYVSAGCAYILVPLPQYIEKEQSNV